MARCCFEDPDHRRLGHVVQGLISEIHIRRLGARQVDATGERLNALSPKPKRRFQRQIFASGYLTLLYIDIYIDIYIYIAMQKGPEKRAVL